MSTQQLSTFFLYNTLINYAMLWLWFLMYARCRGWYIRWWRHFFPVTDEQFNLINLTGIGLYKMGIMIFGLAPWIALKLMGY